MSDEDSGPSTSNRTKLDNESDESGDVVKLSESIFMFPNRTIGQHDNVYEGEVRSSVYGVRPCVIKFAEISEQNVKEAEILTKLGSHTNVIAIIQSGTYCDVFQDRVFIALDKCHNENLRQYLANRKAAGIEFDLNQAIDFAKQIIVGVMYIHDNNVIHLDLKPSNILISQNLHLIKIADFGLSIIVKSPKSKVFQKHQFGTNGYRPIESCGNGEVSMRTDIFSLGTVLLHLLSNGNDVFGVDEHTFIHNVMNDVTNTTGLLVCNPVTTEHLIKCMVSKERCHRPSIWEVFDHPCWTGKEVECNFEYFGDDEVHDDATDDVDVAVMKEIASTSDIERERNFLAKMREMGFNRKPTILIFDASSRHLHRFHFENKSMTKMHSYPKDVRVHNATTLGEYIYFFEGHKKSNYRLEYCDVTATWERMSWPDGIEMEYIPLVTASSDAIFLVGIINDRFVIKYSPPLDRWERLPDRSINHCRSAVYSNGFLYCICSDDHLSSNNKVERLNLETMKWESMADTNSRGIYNVAVECGGNIYNIVTPDLFNPTDIYIDKYDPKVDKWTHLKPVMIGDLQKSRRRWIVNAFAIYGDLYIVFYQHVLKYDVKKNELDIFASFPNMSIRDAVLVKMSD